MLTSTASDDQIDDFYGNLEDVIDNLPRRDLIILMGNFIAKIGKLHEKYDNIGVNGLRERNGRGDKREEFCMANSFFIGNTLFAQPPRRLYTWVSPGDRARKQIDYIMVHETWRSSMLGIKTRPSADCGSDQQL